MTPYSYKIENDGKYGLIRKFGDLIKRETLTDNIFEVPNDSKVIREEWKAEYALNDMLGVMP